MLIALAGLATTHPYTDARSLQEHAKLAVWEPDPQRLAWFRAEHPSATVAPDLAALLDMGPAGVVLTVPTPQVAAALEPVLARDLPCFINKPAAATAAQLAALEPVVARAPHRVLSSSVLRFAPGRAAFGCADRRSGSGDVARLPRDRGRLPAHGFGSTEPCAVGADPRGVANPHLGPRWVMREVPVDGRALGRLRSGP